MSNWVKNSSSSPKTCNTYCAFVSLEPKIIVFSNSRIETQKMMVCIYFPSWSREISEIWDSRFIQPWHNLEFCNVHYDQDYENWSRLNWPSNKLILSVLNSLFFSVILVKCNIISVIWVVFCCSFTFVFNTNSGNPLILF